MTCPSLSTKSLLPSLSLQQSQNGADLTWTVNSSSSQRPVEAGLAAYLRTAEPLFVGGCGGATFPPRVSGDATARTVSEDLQIDTFRFQILVLLGHTGACKHRVCAWLMHTWTSWCLVLWTSFPVVLFRSSCLKVSYVTLNFTFMGFSHKTKAKARAKFRWLRYLPHFQFQIKICLHPVTPNN